MFKNIGNYGRLGGHDCNAKTTRKTILPFIHSFNERSVWIIYLNLAIFSKIYLGSIDFQILNKKTNEKNDLAY